MAERSMPIKSGWTRKEVEAKPRREAWEHLERLSFPCFKWASVLWPARWPAGPCSSWVLCTEMSIMGAVEWTKSVLCFSWWERRKGCRGYCKANQKLSVKAKQINNLPNTQQQQQRLEIQLRPVLRVNLREQSPLMVYDDIMEHSDLLQEAPQEF